MLWFCGRHAAALSASSCSRTPRGLYYERLQRKDGLRPCLDGGLGGNLEVPDHFHSAGAGLRYGCASAAQQCVCRSLSIKAVRLAVLMAGLPVGWTDFVNRVPPLAQEPRRACAIQAHDPGGEGRDAGVGAWA